MKVIIAGSRNFYSLDTVTEVMASLGWKVDSVVCGASRGADKCGEDWADLHGIQVYRFPADWDTLGKRAGYIRNEEMADNAEALIALWDGKSKGTKHMIDIAKDRGLEVHIHRTDNNEQRKEGTMLVSSLDFETFLIDEFNTPNPQPICMGFCHGDDNGRITQKGVYGTEEYEEMRMMIVSTFAHADWIVMQNAKFDALCAYFWMDDAVKEAVFKAYREGRVVDPIIREKLINLTMYGSIDMIELANGANRRVSYALDALEKHYLGIDRSEQKKGDNIWRTNYDQLVGVPVDEWPEEARDYVVQDAEGAFRVALAQDERRVDVHEVTGHDPFAVEEFRTMADLCLGFMTHIGNKVDRKTLAAVKLEYEDLYNDPRLVEPLVEAGFITPAKDPEPYRNRAKEHLDTCVGHKDHPEYKKGRKVDCDCPLKMKNAEPEHTNTNTIRAYVKALCETDDRFRIKYTPKSIENEKAEAERDGRKVDSGNFTVQVNIEWLEEYASLDRLLSIYYERKQHEKMITTYIPAMFRDDGTPAETIRAPFDVLKRTGRTSSFNDSLYPSTNGQNADPRIRKCYVPRDGYCLFSIDYAGMELGTFAQTCKDLFGFSVLADKINAGIKPHGFLGAQIAYATDPVFQEICSSATSRDGVYEIFNRFKFRDEPCDSELFIETFRHDHPEGNPTWIDFFKHYYKFAKPTGLGFPGGLGPDTFVTYAKATYGVELDRDTASELRDIWKETYPEAKKYLNWVNRNAKTDRFPRKSITKNGREFEADSFCYTTPMGLHRGRCDYCACANGKGLQSPGAEGALKGLVKVSTEIYDPSYRGRSVLQPDGMRQYVVPTIFVHDEIFGEIWIDDKLTPRIERVMELMVEGMEEITPDVKAAAEPALMMRWDKRAEELRDEKGNLIIWYPEED